MAAMSKSMFSKAIRSLPEHAPIAERFESRLVEKKSRSRRVWYRNQKEHWLGWLGEYDGPGAYGRQDWDVTGETIYNRVVNSAMVLWLCEAAGVPDNAVRAAADAALTAGDTMQAQSAEIRRWIPWDIVENKLRSSQSE